MIISKKAIIVLSALICYWLPLLAQSSGGGEKNPEFHTNIEALEKWQDMRYGMFIHWGPVTLRGTEIGWSRGREVPKEDYDNLYKEFNPSHFNAAEWVRTAKQAGMKYIIFTAKHHDGFSLWDTKYSDYDIMNTPFEKDILKELSKESKKQGIEFGIYYSIADWYHPDYPGEYPSNASRDRKFKTEEERQSMSRYITFMENQLKELINNYDPAVLWFDGEWEWPWTHEMGMELYAFVKQQNEEILINNRVDKGRQGMAGMTISEKYAGDFGTPEQEVGNYNTQVAWESCITIGQQWAWKPNDKLKTTKDMTTLLLNTIGGGGNLLLNIGPMPDGRIEQRQVNRLRNLGQWVSTHKEAIFGSMGGPYVPTDYMVSTRKGNKIYLHLLKEPSDILSLPFPEGVKITEAKFLNNNTSLNLQQSNGQIQIDFPDQLANNNSIMVIELEVNKQVEELSKIERYNY